LGNQSVIFLFLLRNHRKIYFLIKLIDMKKNVPVTFLKFLMLGLVSLLSNNSTIYAQAISPFGCNGSYYVTYGDYSGAANTTSIDKVTVGNNGITTTHKGSTANYGFNGCDISPIDGFMYGIRYIGNSTAVDLLKIDSNGNVTTVGTLPSSVNNKQGIYAGCFDMNGDYYIANQPVTGTGPGNICSIYKVNITNANATLVGSTGMIPQDTTAQLFFVDIAIDPTTGVMYGATNYCCNENGSNSRSLYTINKTTGLATRVGMFTTAQGASTSGYGLFFTANGNLFLYGTDANFYLVNKTTAAITAIGTGSSYTFADGASCSYRIDHTLATSAPTICLSGTATTTNPVFTETFINNRGSIVTGAAYHLDLDPRFKFTQTTDAIKDTLLANGIATSLTTVTIANINGGTNNSIDISPINIPYSGPGTTTSFTLNTLFTNSTGLPTMLMASRIYNLPAIIGSISSSDDPLTIIPNDSTAVRLCDASILPVTFISLNAVPDPAGSILVQWHTAEELNVRDYEISRSIDGTNFTAIGKVAATDAGGYSFTDKSVPASGKIFYRVTAIDVAGKTTITPIVTVNLSEKQFAITVTPNPFEDNIKLQILSSQQQQATVRIFGGDGKLYQSFQLNVQKGSSVTELNNTVQFPAGVYAIFVNMEGTGDIYSKKIIKQ
jgi:hypothetical protein